MGIVPVLVLAALGLSAVGVALFAWAVRDGQFEDIEGEASRALHDGPALPARGPLAPRSPPPGEPS